MNSATVLILFSLQLLSSTWHSELICETVKQFYIYEHVRDCFCNIEHLLPKKIRGGHYLKLVLDSVDEGK